MRRVLTAVACLLMVGASCVGAAGAAGGRHVPTNLLINAQEWSLWPSRTSVPAGTVYVGLWNRGQDMHDTLIRRVDAAGQMVGPIVGRVKVTMPGRISDATWHLRRGNYELYCSMAGHMKLGMRAKLAVTR